MRQIKRKPGHTTCMHMFMMGMHMVMMGMHMVMMAMHLVMMGMHADVTGISEAHTHGDLDVLSSGEGAHAFARSAVLSSDARKGSWRGRAAATWYPGHKCMQPNYHEWWSLVVFLLRANPVLYK